VRSNRRWGRVQSAGRNRAHGRIAARDAIDCPGNAGVRQSLNRDTELLGA